VLVRLAELPVVAVAVDPEEPDDGLALAVSATGADGDAEVGVADGGDAEAVGPTVPVAPSDVALALGLVVVCGVDDVLDDQLTESLSALPPYPGPSA
jgi:hypothetical protein